MRIYAYINANLFWIGEKPFLCNVCGTSFNNRGHLYRHIRSHTSGTLHKRGRPKKCNLYTVKPSTNHDSISISEEIAGDGFDMVEIKTDSSQDHQRLASSSVMTPTYITVHTTPAQVITSFVVYLKKNVIISSMNLVVKRKENYSRVRI